MGWQVLASQWTRSDMRVGRADEAGVWGWSCRLGGRRPAPAPWPNAQADGLLSEWSATQGGRNGGHERRPDQERRHLFARPERVTGQRCAVTLQRLPAGRHPSSASMAAR